MDALFFAGQQDHVEGVVPSMPTGVLRLAVWAFPMARQSSATTMPGWHGLTSVPDQELDDSALVRLVLEKSPRAATIMWTRFSPSVRRVLYRSLGPGSDVEDLVQEVFLRLFRSLPGLREPAALRGFVYTITASVGSSELRRLRVRRWLRLTREGDLPDEAGEVRDDDGREALSRIYHLLAGVSGQDRMIFVLRTLEGLDLAEVAVAVGLSLATVKRRIRGVHQHIESEVGKDPAFAAYLGPLSKTPEGDR